MERILELVSRSDAAATEPEPEIFMVLGSEAAVLQGLAIAEQIRSEQPDWGVVCNCAVSSLKSQFKKS